MPEIVNNTLPVPPADGNKSLVLEKVDVLNFEQRPVKPPGPDEVQVNIRQTGPCFLSLPPPPASSGPSCSVAC